MNKIAEFLKLEMDWYEGLARAIECANGNCVYCGENLVETRLGYSSIEMDHLLPKSIYKKVEWDFDNHVLSCSSCNGMKKNWNPLEEGENALEMLRGNKQEIINRVSDYLSDKIEARENEWQRVRAKFTS